MIVVIVLATALFIPAIAKKKETGASHEDAPTSTPLPSSTNPTVTLTEGQKRAIKTGPVSTFPFPLDIHATGNIDFDEDRNVQVFPQYPGEIIESFGNLGDSVVSGQPLYLIDSPDFIQAESNLISSAAALVLANKTLDRAKALVSGDNGVSQKELEADISAQQAAEGALRAARQSVKIFGKTDAEIDRIVTTGEVEPALVVRSPFSGKIVQKTAPVGLMVQPGVLPAPYAVSDLNLKWMVAQVAETDSPLVREGQPVRVFLPAFPGRKFEGLVTRAAPNVDPVLHTIMVRAEIEDGENLLKPGMLADFTIQVAPPKQSVCLPENGVVRNGDGTHSAWVTTDGKVFTQREIQVGSLKDGMFEVTRGLQPGETAVTDGAVFLSNMLQVPVDD
jgi:cobalt-zinc-cadmium efflux system membrane fusion protein